MEIELVFFLGFLLSAVHFLGEEIEESIQGYREQIVSLGAGISISYVFVQLLPEFHRVAEDRLIFAFPLMGFASLHLVEKYLAKSGLEGEDLRRDYAEVHYGFLFFYHSIIGYLIASLILEDAVTGLLFFVPILIHSAASSFSMNELHEQVSERSEMKIAVSLAPLLGVLVYSSGILSESVFTPLFGAVIGMFFYVAVRDSIPSGKKGKPMEFLVGTLGYLLVILAANLI